MKLDSTVQLEWIFKFHPPPPTTLLGFLPTAIPPKIHCNLVCIFMTWTPRFHSVSHRLGGFLDGCDISISFIAHRGGWVVWGGFENPFELYYNCITSCWMILIKQLAFSRISLWRHFYHDIQHCVRLTKIFFLQFRIIRSYCLSSVVQKIDRKWHGIKINKPSVWLQILSKTAEEIEPVTCQYKYTIWFTSLDCDGFYTHINCRYQYY